MKYIEAENFKQKNIAEFHVYRNFVLNKDTLKLGNKLLITDEEERQWLFCLLGL